MGLETQGAVWNDISNMQRDLRSTSPTAAMKDTTREQRGSLDGVVEAFHISENQVGACVFIDGRMAGMEVVSSPAAFSSFWPRLMRSYVLDSRRLKARPTKQGGNLINRAQKMTSEVLSATWEEFEAVGDGKDLRLEYSGATGSALTYGSGVVHLSVMNSQIQV